MSKRQFKSQASSSRAVSGAGFRGFGSNSSGSTLSYLTQPPNISSISDANIAVCFKNLSKKDGTTKGKALEDLRAYIQTQPYEQDGGPEEAILEAWVRYLSRLLRNLPMYSITDEVIGQILSSNIYRQLSSGP